MALAFATAAAFALAVAFTLFVVAFAFSVTTAVASAMTATFAALGQVLAVKPFLKFLLRGFTHAYDRSGKIEDLAGHGMIEVHGHC